MTTTNTAAARKFDTLRGEIAREVGDKFADHPLSFWVQTFESAPGRVGSLARRLWRVGRRPNSWGGGFGFGRPA